jgi:hypothetical protein
VLPHSGTKTVKALLTYFLARQFDREGERVLKAPLVRPLCHAVQHARYERVARADGATSKQLAPFRLAQRFGGNVLDNLDAIEGRIALICCSIRL